MCYISIPIDFINICKYKNNIFVDKFVIISIIHNLSIMYIILKGHINFILV